MREDVVAVVLAGGQGLRMGGAKPLRPWAGSTLMAAALAQARAVSPLAAIAVRAADQAPPDLGPLLIDDPAMEGPIAGLASAIGFARAHGAAGVLTLPVDAPLAPTDLGPRLRAAFTPDCKVAMVQSCGQLQPTFALWRADLGPSLADYSARGRRSLRGFAEELGSRIVDWGEVRPDPFEGANTPEELARLAARVGGEGGIA